MLLQLVEPGTTPDTDTSDQPSGIAIGIDLGTTNSVVSYVHEGKAQAIPNATGDDIIPSVVAYTEEEILVGHKAQDRIAEQASSVITSIKRLMGRSPAEGDAMDFPLVTAEDQSIPHLKVADKIKTPVEISADILRTLKEQAEAYLDTPVTQAVITVPAYFDDAARQATKDAAHLAGLQVLRLINEPTAAALAYGLDEKAEGSYVVFDLGGGTFDVSALKLTQGVFQVLATGGHTNLGGDDFDKIIAHYLFSKSGISAPNSRDFKLGLLVARRVKEYLSTHTQGKWTMPDATEPVPFDRKILEQLTETLVETMLSICRQVMIDADLTLDAIDGVILVGGSTRMPQIRERVATFFQCTQFSSVDPDKVVAAGAALQAEALTKGSDTLLLDVAPLSLGVETMGELVEKIIHRNTPLPASVTQEFTTYQDGQNALKIHVVQGEREKVEHCRSLGSFTLRGIPPMTAGAARISVTFSIDADGLLTVAAQEKTTGSHQSIEVKPTYGLSEEDMRRILMENAQNAQEDMQKRLLTESKVEAQQLLKALESAIAADQELLTPEELTTLQDHMKSLQLLLEGTARDKIVEAHEKLNELSNPFAERRMNRSIQKGLTGQSI